MCSVTSAEPAGSSRSSFPERHPQGSAAPSRLAPFTRASNPPRIDTDSQERSEDEALVELGKALRAEGYAFVTITPASHRRVVSRSPGTPGHTLRDIFGWNLPFRCEDVDAHIVDLLRRSRRIVEKGGLCRSTVRYSCVGPLLLVHSSYPTDASDSVFLGPDTYRFCAFVERELPHLHTVVDVGCGTGAGGLIAAGRIQRLILSDVNPLALRFARVNCALAGHARAEILESDVLSGVPGRIDAVVSNPPYLVDRASRRYRHGGARGIELSRRIVEESIRRLGPGGRVLLYTGTPVIDGTDLLRTELEPVLRSRCARYDYRELDPDVWGEELDSPAYASTERIALVSLVAEAC